MIWLARLGWVYCLLKILFGGALPGPVLIIYIVLYFQFLALTTQFKLVERLNK